MKRTIIIVAIILSYVLVILAEMSNATTDGEMQRLLFRRGSYFILLLLVLFAVFPKNGKMNVDNLLKLTALIGLLVLMSNAIGGGLIFVSAIALLYLEKKDFFSRR